jgi:hypothetical protein
VPQQFVVAQVIPLRDILLILSSLQKRLNAWHSHCIRNYETNQGPLMTNQHESTYALLMRSEEKRRTILETVLYAFFFLSVVCSIWQFAQEARLVPSAAPQPATELVSDSHTVKSA